MVYAAILSESQKLMRWQLILEDFANSIQLVDGVENIVADTLSRFPSTLIDKYESITRKAQCRADEIFAISGAENNGDFFPLNLLNEKI